MLEILLAVQIVLLCTLIGILIYFLRSRSDSGEKKDLLQQLLQMQKALELQERLVREEFSRIREGESLTAKQNREELSRSFQVFTEGLMSRMTDIATVQSNQMDSFSKRLIELTAMNESKLENIRKTVEAKLVDLQANNEKKLEQMRLTVDEKLHATLEQRLGESFKLVSDRLEKVHQGLGEMQTLATGVGDLKKVLTNVKTRGNWGEVQLSQLLEEFFTPEQYAVNIATKPGSSDRVEFALKIPAKDEAKQNIWLPIDAKFPLEDYQRLLEAQEKGDSEEAENSGHALELRIKAEARSIKEKYIDPPHTTDFAIMFLPVEGLYAEVLRRPGLFDFLQREYRVVLNGPTTVMAFLSSLQMGFRTLAIEQRSSEVWALLGAVRSEFGKFGELLDKTQKKLQEASNHIENAAKKSRTIEHKLNHVQKLPPADEEKEVSYLFSSDD